MPFVIRHLRKKPQIAAELSGLPNEPTWPFGNPSQWSISGYRRLLVVTRAAVSVCGIRRLRQLGKDLDEFR